MDFAFGLWLRTNKGVDFTRAYFPQRRIRITEMGFPLKFSFRKKSYIIEFSRPNQIGIRNRANSKNHNIYRATICRAPGQTTLLEREHKFVHSLGRKWYSGDSISGLHV